MSTQAILDQMKSNVKLIKDAGDFIASMKQFAETQKVAEDDSPKISLPALRYTQDWPKLEENFRAEILTYIEVFWFQNKRLPQKDELLQKFPEIKDFNETIVSIQDSLLNRGIIPYETPTEWLQPNFVYAVNLILTIHDRRSIAAKLKEAELSPKQWKSFLQIPKYAEYFNTCLNEIFDEETQMNMKLKVAELVAAGDLQAIKYYGELKAIYRPQTNNEIIMKALQTVVEIVSMYVPPETVSKIAEEIGRQNFLEVKELSA